MAKKSNAFFTKEELGKDHPYLPSLYVPVYIYPSTTLFASLCTSCCVQNQQIGIIKHLHSPNFKRVFGLSRGFRGRAAAVPALTEPK